MKCQKHVTKGIYRLAGFLPSSRQIRFLFWRKALNILLTSWKTFNDLILS